MRSAKSSDYFPYTMKTVCYIEVDKHGNISQIHHKNKSDIPGVEKAYQRVLSGSTTLYAVWPGNWSSDLFIIDDLKAFAEAFEIENE